MSRFERNVLASFTGLCLLAFAAFVAWAIWLEWKHPCTHYDPQEKTMWMTQSCGKNCTVTLPVTYHDCLERQP